MKSLNSQDLNKKEMLKEKDKRQSMILDLISSHNVKSQMELVQYLRDAGFNVTQATVSRDAHELNLKKVSFGRDGQKLAVADSNQDERSGKYLRVLRDGYVSMNKAGNILVIRTVSGMAMAVAASIDEMNWPEVAGCIAGDDTIFCAIRSEVETDLVMNKINEILS